MELKLFLIFQLHDSRDAKIHTKGLFSKATLCFFFDKLCFSLNFFLEDKVGSHESHDKSLINPMKIRSNCSY